MVLLLFIEVKDVVYVVSVYHLAKQQFQTHLYKKFFLSYFALEFN